MSAQKKTVTADSARVMIVDDHPSLCEGLRYRISSQPDMMVCGQAADAGDALRQVGELQPHVVIVDIGLKNSNGLDLIKAIRSQHPQIRLVVHTMYDESLYGDRCLRAGAMAYVNKQAEASDVIQAIRTVLAGHLYLTPELASSILGRTASGGKPKTEPVDTLTDRQLEIFRLIGDGKTTAQIAALLHISVHTVETHRENIKRKLGIDTISELTRRAVLWNASQT